MVQQGREDVYIELVVIVPNLSVLQHSVEQCAVTKELVALVHLPAAQLDIQLQIQVARQQLPLVRDMTAMAPVEQVLEPAGF